QLGGGDGGGAAMVRLLAAAGDHRVGALRARFGEQELELADLVARQRRAGEVVTLHQQLDAELLRQTRHRLARRGRARSGDAVGVPDHEALTKGLARASSPMVVGGPWPAMTRVSGSSEYSRVWIDRSMVG